MASPESAVNAGSVAQAPVQNSAVWHPAKRQTRDRLTNIVAQLAGTRQQNTIALEIGMNTALHLIIGRWVSLIQSGVTSKRRFLIAVFEAVDGEEINETEQQLRDRLNTLKGTDEIKAKSTKQKGSKWTTVSFESSIKDSDIEEVEEKPKIVREDVRFLTAEAVAIVLRGAPWGTKPSSVKLNNAGNSTLRAIQGAIKDLVSSFTNKYGKAEFTWELRDDIPLAAQVDRETDDMEGGILMETDQMRTANGERHGRCNDDEALELLNIDLSDPAASFVAKADALNDCMAVRATRQGLPKPLDRSAHFVAGQLRSEWLAQYL